MPVYTSDALILRTYKLGESDRIVVFLTRDRGKKRGVARSARRPRSRFGGGLEPLTDASVVYFEREGRDLVRLNDVEPRVSPLSACNPDALGYVGYFVDLIDQWAPDSDPNERLYRLGVSMLDAFRVDVPLERLARYFEYWLLRLQGVYPSITGCHRCGQHLSPGGATLAARDRTFVCHRCGVEAGSVALPDNALAFLRAATKVRPNRLGEVDLSPEAGRDLERVHRALIELHLDKRLKSAHVLREMRGGYSQDL